MYIENPTRLGYHLTDSDIEVLEQYLNSKEEAILLVDETFSFLYDVPPLISRFKSPKFSHLSFYSSDKFCFWDNLGLAWGIGTTQLVKILLMYQQTMVFCPTTPLVHAFAELFRKFNTESAFKEEFFALVK